MYGIITINISNQNARLFIHFQKKKKQSQVVKAVTKFQITSLATVVHKFEGTVENNGSKVAKNLFRIFVRNKRFTKMLNGKYTMGDNASAVTVVS